MTKAKKIENFPRWQSLNLKDLMCLHYWFNLIITVIVIFNLDSTLTLLLDTFWRKLAAIMGYWFLNVIIYQSLLGTKKSLLSIWNFFLSPFSLVRVAWGFLRDSITTLKKIKQNIPYRLIFIFSLPLTLILGFTETNYYLMMFFFYLIPLQIFFLMRFTWLWTLNPTKFLDKFKEVGAAASIIKMTDSLATFDPKKKLDTQAVTEKFTGFKKMVEAVVLLSKAISNPALTLRLFIGLWTFVGGYIILSSAVFLRVVNLTITSNALVADESLFHNQAWQYLYVTANSFVGADLHGIKVNSPVALFVLSFLPYASLFLLGIVILAYSTVTQSSVNDKFSSIANGVVDIIAKASEKATIVLETSSSKELKTASQDEALDLEKDSSAQ